MLKLHFRLYGSVFLLKCCKHCKKNELIDNFVLGLDVTQIVITAATPMKESTEDEPTRAAEDSRVEADQSMNDNEESEDTEGEATFLEDDRGPPPPPAPEGGGGSGVEERQDEYDFSLPTAFPPSLLQEDSEKKTMPGKDKSLDSNSNSTPKSPSPSDGPPDLDPEKLKTLEKIRESIA